ncbi:MAG: SDR family NAD(P)-dependent oxidoreductase [Ilumatobacter fluminis]|uniref:SDR family NAD(P)-dependent oxidoreductase n=1 Tax=Ilumatobacter fluminis TaxID=467091 RepID=UPI0032ED4512
MELGSGKVAVVTGAGSGIGLALANGFASAGCSVVLADVQDDALAAAADEVGAHGVETLALKVDVSKREEVEALAATTVERFGGVHVVCNNAGVVGAGDPWLGPIEGWEWVMGVNFWGVVHGIRAFLPHLVMSGGGHIVNTASMAGLYPGLAGPYDASKHAVVAVSENLYNSMQAAQMPVGVSCLCPGWVKTGIVDSDRNWPAELGELPPRDIAQEIQIGHVRRAIDEGMQPSAVASLVLDAVRDDRYWVIPHGDWLEIALERWHRVAERQNPEPPEEFPGMPPRSEMIAQMMEAMAHAMGDGAG